MESGKIRLNKFLAESGICSRREADRLIEAGKVIINDHVAKVGEAVEPGDRVEYEGLEHQVINMESLKIRGLTFSWVDGLGSFPENPFRNDNQDAWGWGHRVRFTLCMRGDSILYRTEWDEEYERALEVIRIRDEFLSAVSIPRLESGTSLPVLSDLQGRRLREAPKRGVYIKDGKAVVN